MNGAPDCNALRQAEADAATVWAEFHSQVLAAQEALALLQQQEAVAWADYQAKRLARIDAGC